MDAKVSVVVPIYKVEKYLDRCVQSLFNQTYENLEIILVDDGSPDNCPAMCDEYAKADSRVTVVHKPNGGLPDARNAGMDVATGDYLLFVDSDDWIEPQTVAELAQIIEEQNVDFVTFKAVWDGRPGIPDGTPCTYEKSRELGLGYYDSDRIKKEIYPRVLVTPDLYYGPILAAWSSFYSMAFLNKNGIRFDKEIKYSEDSLFSARVTCAAKSLYAHNGCYYHYCFNGDSISQSFHADLWDVEKLRQSFFVKYFGNRTDFNIDVQLKRMAIFSVLCSISEWHYIKDKSEQRKYINSIFNDPFTINAMKNIKYAQVPIKKRILLYMIKFKMTTLYMKL
ncbi:MAG: glycosyltransferase family 2 protein [Ruminococcaceae bacterium]|nr:glycosyltransferase family 2 protein [Oscillospiraceae bacterium]